MIAFAADAARKGSGTARPKILTGRTEAGEQNLQKTSGRFHIGKSQVTAEIRGMTVVLLACAKCLKNNLKQQRS
jgi:hypothetical protein